MKVLILASSFTPDAVVAAHRFSNIVTHMPKFGIHPIVLATSKRQSLGIDTSLPRISTPVIRVPMIPEWPPVINTTISRIGYKLWNIISPIDNAFGWVPFAVKMGVRIVKENNIKIVIATCPPRSALFAAYTISKLTGAKLVLDYRDPWTGYKWQKNIKYNSMLYRYLEKRIIKKSKALVVCTNYMRNSLENILKANSKMIKVITNGYTPGNPKPVPPEEGAFNITYAGNFYGDRNLRILIDPILKLQRKSTEEPNIRIHVYGDCLKEDTIAFKKANLGNILVQHSEVSHDRILELMAGSDALFLPSGKDVLYALPYKLYDYLKANKPILAVAPLDSALHDFMNNHNIGEYAELDNSDSIYQALYKIANGLTAFSTEGLSNFYWRSITERYCKYIKSVSCLSEDSAKLRRR